MKTTSQIRHEFINFFEHKHGHTFVASSSVTPINDPTLLFTNPGMKQFLNEIGALTGRCYCHKMEDSVDFAFRAIADHAKMLLFSLTEADDFMGTRLIGGVISSAPPQHSRDQAYLMRRQLASCVLALGWIDEGRANLVFALTDDLVEIRLSASALLIEPAQVIVGSGGRMPAFAPRVELMPPNW